MSNRNTAILVLTAIVALLAGIGLFQIINHSPQAPTGVKTKPVLSAIPFIDQQGRHKVLADWQQPVLVVNFWAPWCLPCRREIPALISIQKEYPQQVQIIGLALDSIENVEKFSAEYSINYPSFIVGANIALYNAAFNNKSGSLPFTAILDRNRKLQYVHTGEITSRQLREKINALL